METSSLRPEIVVLLPDVDVDTDPFQTSVDPGRGTRRVVRKGEELRGAKRSPETKYFSVKITHEEKSEYAKKVFEK